jgi:DNA-binding GntR family transcriptional regulator
MKAPIASHNTTALPEAAAAPAHSDADIHDDLVRALLDQRLQPGTRLGEEQLGQVYGVSRTRIRQVLIRLAQSQLVTLSPNKGASVAEPTVQAAREVFEVRRLVEPTLMARAIERASAADFKALAAEISAEEAARRCGDTALALRLSGEFHLHIARLADHATLERLLQELVSRTALVLMRYGSQRPPLPAPAPQALPTPARWVEACNCREHRGLLKALRQRNVASAQQRMQDHLLGLEAALCFNPPAPPEAGLAQLLRPVAGPLPAPAPTPTVQPPRRRPRRATPAA